MKTTITMTKSQRRLLESLLLTLEMCTSNGHGEFTAVPEGRCIVQLHPFAGFNKTDLANAKILRKKMVKAKDLGPR